MKKTNINNNDLDKVFKDGLGDFQVPTPSFHKQSDPSELDDALRSKLNSFEMEPDEKNWNEIKKRIPLSLKMQRHLNLWSKIAAVLIVGLATSLLVANYQGFETVAEEDSQLQPALPYEESQSDFVYEVQDKDEEEENAKKREPTFKELSDSENEIEVVVQVPVEELPKIETKVNDEVTAEHNPLDGKLKRSEKAGEMPLQIQKPVDEVMLGLTPEEEKKAASKKQN